MSAITFKFTVCASKIDPDLKILAQKLEQQKKIIAIYLDQWNKRPDTKARTLLSNLDRIIFCILISLERDNKMEAFIAWAKYYEYFKTNSFVKIFKLPKGGKVRTKDEIEQDVVSAENLFVEINKEASKFVASRIL